MKKPQIDILMISTEKDIFRMLEKYCKSKRPEIICKFSNGGIEVLDGIHQNPPKVIVLDVFLPSMTGYDLCRHMKSHPELKHIHIFYFTTIYEEIIKSKVDETGADGYIHMPASFSDFDPVIEQVRKK